MDLITQGGGFLTLFKKRNFLRLWLAQVISLTVFNASNSALLVLINTITGGSTTQIGLAIICFSLPAVLFGAPAGVVVDHMDKRLVLWGSNCLRALATFLFVLLLFLDRQTILPFIYLLTFLISTISQFFTPAEGSTIPLLVDKDELFPQAAVHPAYRIGAYTIGGVRDLVQNPAWQLGLGTDVTVYSMPAALQASYGNRPVSFQIFLRLQPGINASQHHP